MSTNQLEKKMKSADSLLISKQAQAKQDSRQHVPIPPKNHKDI